VGKTTVAAGLALYAAEQAGRTLVCRWTPKGDVAAYFETGPTSFAAREVFPSLWAMSMDTEGVTAGYLASISDPGRGSDRGRSPRRSTRRHRAPVSARSSRWGVLLRGGEKHDDLVVVDASHWPHRRAAGAPQAINDLVKVA